MSTSSIRLVTDADLPRADQGNLIAALKQWQADGEDNPLIPTDVDVDGDGTADAYGLDAFGRLVYVSGANLADTVHQATGGDPETGQGVDAEVPD